jgi:hypothetical protein
MSFLVNTLLRPVVVALWNQYQLDRLGHVASVDLDKSRRTVKISLELDGESSPIDLEFLYAVAGEDRIEVTEVKCSRPWMATLVNEFVPAEKKRFTVPAVAARLL